MQFFYLSWHLLTFSQSAKSELFSYGIFKWLKWLKYTMLWFQHNTLSEYILVDIEWKFDSLSAQDFQFSEYKFS